MQKKEFQVVNEQLSLGYNVIKHSKSVSYKDELIRVLSEDLDFHSTDSGYASHNFHSFPAKFPPQIPYVFINRLTDPGDVVLDPMSGSGTTVLEAYISGRKGIGFDIDPLAIMISRVKTTSLVQEKLIELSHRILENAREKRESDTKAVQLVLNNRWDEKTRDFIEYWFEKETQLELISLITEIEKIEDDKYRTFFELVFSAIIVTKSGGVSLALDLAHTRPHKAKVVFSKTGKIIQGKEYNKNNSSRLRYITKTLRSPFEEFEKKCIQNIRAMNFGNVDLYPPEINFGNAQNLELEEESVDLIVTSPPYASNAIDYMRAHKFPLVWLGYKIDDLTLKRKEYIGGEVRVNIQYEELPQFTSGIIQEVSELDRKRGEVLHRYYSEMARTLREMFRVLRHGKAAIVVVGSSVMRGKDTETQNCLADIGKEIGFEVPGIGVRKIDRNKRMLPAGTITNTNSQIQRRMHEEFVIGFYKP